MSKIESGSGEKLRFSFAESDRHVANWPGAEIGRQLRLKNVWEQSREGSSPSPATICVGLL